MSKVCLTICKMLFCSFRALLHHQHMCCFDTKTCVSTSTSPTHVLLNTKTYVLAHQPHQHMCCFDTKTCVSAHQPHPRMCCSTQRLMCCSTRRLMCWHINLTHACAAQHEDLCAGTSTSPTHVLLNTKTYVLAHQPHPRMCCSTLHTRVARHKDLCAGTSTLHTHELPGQKDICVGTLP